MRPSIVTSALVLITSFTSSTVALEALGQSPCASQCGNILSKTSGDDMVCHDADFKSSATGSVFQNCITCQLQSKYQDPITKQTDLQWALYNLRWAMSWCLFGYPNNEDVGGTPCVTSTACGPLQPAFTFDSLNRNTSSYGFCSLLHQNDVPKCTSCLKVNSQQFFLQNYVTALQGACAQQPGAGSTVSLQGSLFAPIPVNITDPNSSTINHTYTGAPSRGLTLGAKVGIACGGAFVILALAGFCIVWNGKRRRRQQLRRHQQRTGYADWLAAQETPDPNRRDMSTAGSAGGFFDSPQSQRPLVTGAPWGGRRDEESPMSAVGEKVYFSPYSSQYNSPVSASEQTKIIAQQWPIDRKGSIGGSTGLGAFPSRSRSREKKDRIREDEDGIPMQNVAPVLLHPGHGRQGSGGFAVEEVRHGRGM